MMGLWSREYLVSKSMLRTCYNWDLDSDSDSMKLVRRRTCGFPVSKWNDVLAAEQYMSAN
jgi:hypothetical protein